ncbi:MAG: DUF6364 family protein [Cyanobium sp.]
MNITLSADEKIIERARKAARGMGKSLDQAVRDYLEQLAGGEEGLDAELEALRSLAGRGNSGGQRINRDELYADRLNHSLSFWDALIVQTARAARCRVLYSEDLQAGARIGNVLIVIPFK